MDDMDEDERSVRFAHNPSRRDTASSTRGRVGFEPSPRDRSSPDVNEAADRPDEPEDLGGGGGEDEDDDDPDSGSPGASQPVKPTRAEYASFHRLVRDIGASELGVKPKRLAGYYRRPVFRNIHFETLIGPPARTDGCEPGPSKAAPRRRARTQRQETVVDPEDGAERVRKRPRGRPCKVSPPPQPQMDCGDVDVNQAERSIEAGHAVRDSEMGDQDADAISNTRDRLDRPVSADHERDRCDGIDDLDPQSQGAQRTPRLEDQPQQPESSLESVSTSRESSLLPRRVNRRKSSDLSNVPAKRPRGRPRKHARTDSTDGSVLLPVYRRPRQRRKVTVSEVDGESGQSCPSPNPSPAARPPESSTAGPALGMPERGADPSIDIDLDTGPVSTLGDRRDKQQTTTTVGDGDDD